MGQEQYLLRTGVGFDIDRSGAKDSYSFLESLADSINTMQTKKSVDGIQKRNGQLKKLNESNPDKAKEIAASFIKEFKVPRVTGFITEARHGEFLSHAISKLNE